MLFRSVEPAAASPIFRTNFASQEPPKKVTPMVTAPLFVTNVHSTERFTTPLTASPAYDINESPLHVECSVEIPKGMEASSLTVEIEENGKAMRVTGDSSGKVFSKRFAWGGTMDVSRVQSNFANGNFTIGAPCSRKAISTATHCNKL